MKTVPTQDFELIDRKTLMQKLNLSEPTICNLTKRGKLKSTRIGHKYFYKWPQVIEAMEDRK